MCSILFHFIGYEFEGFPHAVLDHLLFSFFCFFKLLEQEGHYFTVYLFSFEVSFHKGFDRTFVFIYVPGEVLDKVPTLRVIY